MAYRRFEDDAELEFWRKVEAAKGERLARAARFVRSLGLDSRDHGLPDVSKKPKK